MKLAAVRLEAESFADPRFAHLERLLGFPPCRGQLGLIRVALIWSWQTEHYTPETPCFHVPESVIEMALEVDGPTAIAALVRARLAVEEPEGVRMKGADHERTGWLWRTRQKGRAGAEAKHAKRKRGDSKNGNAPDKSVAGADHGHTTGEAQVNPLSSLLSVPETLSLGSRTGARDPGAPAPEPVPVAVGTVPSAPAVVAMRPKPGGIAALVTLAVQLLNTARAELDPAAQPVTADQGDEMAAAGHLRTVPEAEREPAIRRGVAVIAELVRVGREPFGALRPGELFGPRAWRKYQAESVEAIRRSARGRDGSAARASPRADRGQAPVSTTAQRFDGDVPL